MTETALNRVEEDEDDGPGPVTRMAYGVAAVVVAALVLLLIGAALTGLYGPWSFWRNVGAFFGVLLGGAAGLGFIAWLGRVISSADVEDADGY